jgi:hypothetical protein
MPTPSVRSIRVASPRSVHLHFVTTWLDPVVHADLSAAWIAGSSPAMTIWVSAWQTPCSSHRLNVFERNVGTLHAPHPRQLPVRPRRIRDYRAAHSAAELQLLAMPPSQQRKSLHGGHPEPRATQASVVVRQVSGLAAYLCGRPVPIAPLARPRR